MKRLLIVSFLFIIGLCSAQDRTRIDGKIAVPMGNDPAGITIVNTSSGQGTISSQAGTFSITVAPRDTLQFSALQYQEFSIVINQDIIDAGRLMVRINEAVTELPEVVVSPVDLTGYVEIDVMKIPTEDVDLPDMTAAEIVDSDYDFRPDDQTSPGNAAMREDMIFSGRTGAFGNIFRHIFTSRSRSAVTRSPDIERRDLSNIDEQIQQLYDNEFFVEHLGIPREDIYEFIFFAEDNGLDEEMLEEENEMDLVRFLIEQSEEFKSQ